MDWGRPDTVVDDKILRAIIEIKLDNTVRDYAEELGVPPSTTSGHLKLNIKV